jgi:hypothetical protein
LRPGVEHLEKRLAVVVQPDRLKYDRRGDALRCCLDHAHDIWTSDAHACHMAAINAQVIQQG